MSPGGERGRCVQPNRLQGTFRRLVRVEGRRIEDPFLDEHRGDAEVAAGYRDPVIPIEAHVIECTAPGWFSACPGVPR